MVCKESLSRALFINKAMYYKHFRQISIFEFMEENTMKKTVRKEFSKEEQEIIKVFLKVLSKNFEIEIVDFLYEEVIEELKIR